MSQYALSLTLPPIFSAGNFLVSGCNREAWQWMEAWPRWASSHSFLLYGPSGCGKSHLGHIWAQRADAMVATAGTLNTVKAGQGNWLIEDIEQVKDERGLLHLFNYIREKGGSLLLTSSVPAASLPFTLPDLTSRLLALPSAAIHQPDDEALAGAIRKQFADRQIKIEEDVISYLVPRMERSLAQAKALVEMLDAKALAEGKTITVPFVRKALEELL